MDKSAKTLPASFVQKRMWLLARLDPQASISYHIANGVRLIGELDIHALRAALDRIVFRHEVLRTSLVDVNGQIRQRIQPPSGFTLVHEDAGACIADPAAIARIAQQEARQPFDLELEAPVRGRLLRVAADEHVLLLTFHHIACDGWSIGVLLHELEALYAAFLRQQPDPLPPLSIQYADYAIWQSEQLQGDMLDAQLRFWTGQLAGAPALLPLPTDRPRPAMQDYRGAIVECMLPAELGQQLNALARRHGCSLFVTLLAGWALLLARIGATDDVVIGTPVAGRTHPDLEPLIGCFINTLALRLTLSGAPNVAQWLAHVRNVVLTAQDHQELPFERVVEALQPSRSLRHTPIFQVLFSLDAFSADASLQLPGLRLDRLPDAADSCAFDLILAMQESPAGLHACLKYPVALFEGATVERYLAQFVALLQGMVGNEFASIQQLPWLPQVQREQLQCFNATAADLPAVATVHQALYAQVQRTPRTTALVDGECRLTYAQLWDQAASLAAQLRHYGLLPGQPLALLLPRSATLVVAQLAALRCGAYYVPMDVEQPAERLGKLLGDCRARLALVPAHAWQPDLPGLHCLDPEQLMREAAAPLPALAGHPRDLAYVMYTSGSTGMPKGVAIAHAAVLNLVLQDGPARLHADDRVGFASNPAFDSATLEVWGSLLNGASVVVVPAPVVRDPQALSALLRRERLSVLILVAGVLRAYAPLIAAPLSALRLLVTGGDVADPHAIAHVLDAGGPVRVLQTYGPTESTQFVTAVVVDSAPDSGQRVPIGRPLANTRLHVLDRYGQPVPIGVGGELHIAGAQLAQGYLHRPDISAERFVPDPFADRPGERMYRSGDLARWRADGSLEFLGRNDAQVKLRGFRIEPGEIEAALGDCAGIGQAAVLLREDAGHTRLVAYVVCEDPPNAEHLRAALAAHLPDYMLPAAYVHLDALPLTANGKLDRRALPAPDADALAVQTYAPPEGELETRLAALWGELLGIAQIGRHDDFFALGGHSLLAVQLASRIRLRLGLTIGLAELFAHPRLADLAAALAAASSDDHPAIVASARTGPLPLSFAQERLWFLHTYGDSGSAYTLTYALRLRGALDTAALCRALDRIVERHEALRTHFIAVDGQPQQVIAPASGGCALSRHDLSSDSDPLQSAHAHADAEAQLPFDLASGPLLHASLLRLDAQDHVLLLTAHHIIADAWSGAVLVNELTALYTAFAQGAPDPLAPLQIQYPDVALWQRRWIAGERLQRQLDHWVAHLRGAPALLELPTDFPRPARPDYRGEVVPFHLDAAQTAALKALAQRHGATLFMVLLAAWAALLARLSGQREVVIGTPIANRQYPELEPLIGLFVNSLALRIDLRSDPSVAALLAQTRATALAGQACQDVPFEQVVEALNPVRSHAYNPLFQVMFAWQNTPDGQLALPGLTVDMVQGTHRAAQFDLELSMQESGEGIVGSLGFATALFTRSSIHRHLRQLLTLLARMAADETLPVSALSAIAPAELALLHDFNATATAMAVAGAGAHALFERQAQRTPTATALIDADRSLSYAELDAQANRLAHHLIVLGVGPDSRVALCLERRAELIVAMLATLKAGGAYVPLDPTYPPLRLAHMLADSAPCVVLADAQSAAALDRPAGIPLLLLDQSQPPWGARPSTAPEVTALHAGHLAYVIYTSGSTGTPKGVAVDHGGLRNYCVAAAARYGLRGDDRVLQCSSPSFDIAVDEIFVTLCSGATLVLLPSQRLPAIAAFVDVIARTRISILNLPTAYWHAWMAEQAECDAALPPSLRLVVCGGEAPNPASIERWHALADGRVRLLNAYGPTETVSGVSFGTLQPGQPVHIGGPIANVCLHVLDRRRQLAPLGVDGELYIAGVQVARGYLGRPDLTAERFVPDPFAPVPGARMYRSGDRVRWREDGTLLFVGRDDQQIKLRGFRIEPGEIESALRTAPGVRDAAVLVRELRPGEPGLVAYVAAAALADDALRAHLAARLPTYMLPAHYVRLDALPLTANGKLDRQALPAVETAHGDPVGAPPKGADEVALAQLWCEVLAIDRVSRDDDFFALGGHSLLAVQLIARVRDRLGIELQIGDVFTHTRLQALALCLQREEHGSCDDARSIAVADRTAPLPLSFAQQRLWFLDRFDPSSRLAYLMPGGVRLRGALDRQALQQALDRIVDRHEVLRTSIAVENDEPVQRIGPVHAGFPLQCLDLSDLPDPEASARAHAAEEAGTRFDLARAPLIRGRLLRLAAQEHLLLVTMHHIASDGWSMNVLIRELSELYAAFAQGAADPLPALRVQYADYSVWQRQRISGETLARQRDFWRTHLQDAPAVLELPTDRPRPAQQDHAGELAHFTLDRADSAALAQLSQRHGTTAYMSLLAVWAVLLARLAGKSDVVIGTPVANRTHAELEPLIGLFVNTQALRVDLARNPSVAELLAQVRATALAAQAHQDLPFEQLIETLNPARTLAHHPVFQVMFTWHNSSASDRELALPGLQLEHVPQSLASLKFDLDLMLQEHDGCIVGTLAYSSALFKRTTVQRWLRSFVRLLQAFAHDDAAHVLQLPLLDTPQQRQLAGFGTGAIATVPEHTLPRLLEAQARRTPDAIAVVCGQRSLSYAALDAHANALAQRLLAVGVRAGERVAIALPRSAELIVAELAVLKCGAAYVPLDSGHPEQRLRAVIADAQARVLIDVPDSALASLDPVERLTVDRLDAAAPRASAPTISVANTAAAYVMYTSGSTGTPKGVVVSHGAVLNLVLQDGPARMRADDRVGFASNPAFDSATLEVWGSLLNGATVVVVPAAVMREPLALGAVLERERLSVLILVAGVLRAYAPLIAPQLGALRQLLTGGDVADPRALAQILNAGGQARIVQTYGPTESTQFVTALVLEQAPEPTQRVPIGRPLANARLYVCDRHGQPTPIGVAGQLHIAGPQLAHGYLGRPDLTAERFVPDPFAEHPGQRMYRSGDLARWRDDGLLEFLGRNDHQVKIRGFRIEPGEIEAALRTCNGVREAVVVARDDTGEKRLVAYVVADRHATPAEPAALRSQLATHLPDHMHPAAYVQLDALPLTPNGKLDRAALPAPDDQALELHAYVAPEDAFEQVLAALWSELLGVAQVGRHDDFFALGGHSLLAVKLIERLRRLGWQIDVRTLFASPTLAALAGTVQTWQDVAVPPNPIGPACTRLTPELLPLVELSQTEIDTLVAQVDGGAANVQDIYPLAPLQEGLLFHHLSDPLADPYLHSSLLTFPSRASRDAFLDALDQVIARHDILRTGFAWQGVAEPLQVVWRQALLARHLHHFDGADPADQLLAWMHSADAAPCLNRAPLIHAHLTHDAVAERWLLGLQHHHLVMDHTTLELMVEEIGVHLQQRQHTLPPPLPFRDFIVHARGGVSAQEHTAFFTEMLAGIDTPTAPFGVLAPVRDQASFRQIHVPLPTALARSLRDQGRRCGISTASLFHLAYALVLARSSGRDDAVFGTLLFGRMNPSAGVDRVLGMFLNTLPIRLGDTRHTVLQAARHTQLCLARLLHHEHAPLALAQRCSALDPSTPLLHALLNYRYAGGSTVLTDESAAHATPLHDMQEIGGQERTHYPLVISVDDEHGSGGFSLDVQCVEQIGAERTAAMMLQTLQALVVALKHAPDTALRALALVHADEYLQLQAFNATDADLPDRGYLHHQIETQAQRTPQAIALVQDDTKLSYAELDARANQLAHHLIALGVGPESRVALCLPRGINVVVAILAVLKAGAAYVPMDPAYPAERLAYMLHDCAPAVLLSERACAGSLPALSSMPELDVLWLDEPLHELALSVSNPDVTIHPDQLAYVIYTSGSTGQPKAAQVTHKGLGNLLSWWVNDLGANADDGVLLVSSISFDLSQKNIFGPLMVGATLFLAPSTFDATQLLTCIERFGIAYLNLAPSAFHALIEADDDHKMRCVRRVVLGGEPIQPDMLQKLPEPRPQFVNSYGPTECTDVVAWYVLHEPLRRYEETVPIGKPLPSTRIHILDTHGRPTPIGVAGELHIAGIQVGRGYLNRPGLTAEHFIPDLFGPPGQRMYRTGDLARWNADGTIDFLGRNDHQLKLRGFRIEPGEIEAALLACPGVRKAVVIAREDLPGDTRLVAYLVGDTDALSADTLQRQLSACLPNVMVPAIYMQLDALPLTANGKLDRRALPAPDAAMTPAVDSLPPANVVERSLAKLWASVLGPQRIGRDDHFFELGGHSLSAMRLMTAANRLGLPLTLNLLYTHPTLRMQADYLLGGTHALGSRALAVRRQGTQLPLFVVPTGLGDIGYAFELAAHIDPDIPVYALPWPDPLPATMEALAAHMVGLIQAVQPHGPYRLLGYSSGGLLAYAIAQHLGMHDQSVAFVGLLDCDLPSTPPDTGSLDHAMGQALVRQLEELVQHRPYQDREDSQATLNALLDRIGDSDYQDMVLACENEPLLAQLAAEEQTTVETFLRHCATSVSFNRLWPTFFVQALPADCRLCLFQASEPKPATDADGWQRLLPASQIERFPVGGTHQTLIEAKHIAALGQTVTRSLGRAHGKPAPASYQPAFQLRGPGAQLRSKDPAVICVPGAGDSVTAFLDLSDELDTCNVIGMQPRGTDGSCLPFGSVELAAQHYLDALPSVTHRGSRLHLIGHSFGGWVVFEMAQRLHALGRPPASLTLIDTPAPNCALAPGDGSRDTIVEDFLDALQMRLHVPLGIDRQALHQLGQDALIDALHKCMVEHRILPPGSRPDSVRGSLATFAQCCRTSYIPAQPYPGSLQMVLVTDPRLEPAQQTAERLKSIQAWTAHASHLQLLHGPGNHMTVLAKPHSQLLAKWWASTVRESAPPLAPHAPATESTTVIS
ncbi:amino acid adenylation domain-containing protein [Xanthomonas oryzae pv. oryzae]|uniref:non-ribosomal peptide synthetase n=2 Tax=Xanthomonas oryzae TaxID=347 RepID=UPI00105892CD|nr:non-ribosomal peptide synthetase [Xanthomonas oryzae]QBN32416.1 amino acid adenylation domain-containing protein [Xanthomonas oryzae pv. oryzae]